LSKSLCDAPSFTQTGCTGSAAHADKRQAATLCNMNRTVKIGASRLADKAKLLLLDPWERWKNNCTN
jgi:hypothetical protein